MVASSVETRLARLEEAEHRRELEHRAAVLADAYGEDLETARRTVARAAEACRRCAGIADPRAAAACIAREMGHDDESAADELLALAEELAEGMTGGMTFEQFVRRRAAEVRREEEARGRDG